MELPFLILSNINHICLKLKFRILIYKNFNKIYENSSKNSFRIQKDGYNRIK